MRRVLQGRYQIVIAEQGSTGLEMATSEHPDLILVDLGLPDMDGQTLISLIKNDPKLSKVPLVAVTAWPEETARQLAQIYGCNGFISKPINTKIFPDQIAQFLPPTQNELPITNYETVIRNS